MKKKLINLMVILVMMLCFYVLTGCDSINLSDYKATKITELQAYADAKGVNNYKAENWLILQQAVTEGKQAVESATTKPHVDTAVETAKTAIDAVEEGEMRDFVMTISVNKTTLAQGENFRVNVGLKNNSEKDFEIIFNYGFIAHVPNFIDFFDPSNPAGEMPEPQTILFEKNSVLQNIGFWGTQEPDGILITNQLNQGRHELSFHFTFSFAGQSIRVWSNKIVLTVQ